MKIHRMNKIFGSLLIAVSAVLWLTGCNGTVNIIGMSDYYYADSEKYTAGGAELTETVETIDINWMVGSVTVLPHDSNTVCVSEKSERDLTEDTRLRYWLDNTTLRIKFCGRGKWNFSELDKDLTVFVPETLMIGKLKVSTLSADVKLSGCAVTRFVEVNTLSGKLDAEFSEPLHEFQGDSTSGTFTVSAPNISRFNFEAVSGSVNLSVQKEPDFLEVDTTSGNVNLNLPENASFTLDYDTTSGNLSSEILNRTSAGKYIFGAGKGEYEIDTMSGDVRITAIVQEEN